MGTHPIFESDFDCLTENGHWTYFYRYQTRRCPARTRWQDHQAIRAARLQTGCNEIVPTWQGAPREALRGSRRQGFLRWTHRVHELWPNLRHGLGGQERRQNGPYDARRDQPTGLSTRLHPW